MQLYSKVHHIELAHGAQKGRELLFISLNWIMMILEHLQLGQYQQKVRDIFVKNK